MEILDRSVKGAGADLIAYCLMDNHYHLAIKVGQGSLASLMQRLLTVETRDATLMVEVTPGNYVNEEVARQLGIKPKREDVEFAR